MIYRKFYKVRSKIDALVSRLFPQALVLIYHRVADLDSDPQRLSVTPDIFDEHMDVLSRKYHPISLAELTDDLDRGRIRNRTVVVTFDDGYEDNYLYARPILEKYGIPATLFISSGYTGTNREFWWDELERLLLTANSLPDVIRVDLNGEACQWTVLNDTPANRQELDSRASVPENVRRCVSRYDIYKDLCARFQRLNPEQIDYALGELRKLTGDAGIGRTNFRPMDVPQLRSLHKGGLIEIGAHTQSHVNLAAQSEERQYHEILNSKKSLETMLGDRVESFSYPFGTFAHYSRSSIKCVHDAGFRIALSNFTGNVYRFTNRYQIPRCMIRNWDGNIFDSALNDYSLGQQPSAA